MKTADYEKTGDMKRLEDKLRLNLQSVIDTNQTKLAKKESEDS